MIPKGETLILVRSNKVGTQEDRPALCERKKAVTRSETNLLGRRQLSLISPHATAVAGAALLN